MVEDHGFGSGAWRWLHRSEHQSLRRLRPPRIGPVILPALRTKRSTGRVSDTRIHVIGFAPSLKLAISKQPSWILLLGILRKSGRLAKTCPQERSKIS